MNTAPQTTAKQKLKYAWRALQLNPATQADQIVRQRLIGLGMTAETDVTGSQEQRIEIRQQLDQVREKFWVFHPEQILELLNDLPVAPYPELKVSVKRMQRLCTVKPLVEKLSRRKEKDINFINTFKRIFLLPPREAGKVKERYLRNLANNPAIARVQDTVRVIREKYPQLYEVESDWFSQMLLIQSRQPEPSRAASASGVSFDLEGMELPFFLIFVVVMFAVRIVWLVFRSAQ